MSLRLLTSELTNDWFWDVIPGVLMGIYDQ